MLKWMVKELVEMCEFLWKGSLSNELIIHGFIFSVTSLNIAVDETDDFERIRVVKNFFQKEWMKI